MSFQSRRSDFRVQNTHYQPSVNTITQTCKKSVEKGRIKNWIILHTVDKKHESEFYANSDRIIHLEQMLAVGDVCSKYLELLQDLTMSETGSNSSIIRKKYDNLLKMFLSKFVGRPNQ